MDPLNRRVAVAAVPPVVPVVLGVIYQPRRVAGEEGGSVLVTRSQVLDSSNAVATSAAAAAADAGSPDTLQQDEFDYMTANFLQQLDDRVDDGYDWSAGCNQDLQDALENYKKSFYHDHSQSILDCTIDDEQVLFNKSKCRPENAHPDEQQLIVYYQHLLFHYRQLQWEVLSVWGQLNFYACVGN